MTDSSAPSAVWETRYRTGDTPWEKGEPSPGLVDFLNQMPLPLKGTVLVPGCGNGHDVRAWANAGWNAVGLDIAPSAVSSAREQTPPGMKAEFRLGNFLADEPFASFDCAFEHTCYCAIEPVDREAYAKALDRWLRPDGYYVAVNYLIPDKEGPPYGTTRDELLHRFSPRFTLIRDFVPRSYPNRTDLERLFVWQKKP
ncbi:MAG: thiopurine S-methyltransferase [Verrucomicrobiales bacterium]|jgi:cyclopropane fatty-acyl-phospholipid synthase-like methyltransferase|nr:thiopurine S-methyltransferase [Verrucomicrobiales bacterium]